MHQMQGHMRKSMDTVKTLIAAAAIAFASTVSAVHVHDTITCSHSTPAVVQDKHDIHDCIYCLVVYQTLTADADLQPFILSGSETLLPDRPAVFQTRFSFDWFGRAPPFSA